MSLPDRILRSCACALPLLAGVAMAQDAPLPAYTADYEVIRNGKTLGSNRTELVRDGDGWRFSAQIKGEHGMAALLGVEITQNARLRWNDGLPQPLESQYRQRAAFGDRDIDTRYDWSAGRYRLVDRKGEHVHPLPADATDRYISGLAIAAKLKSGATDFSFAVAYPDGIRQWRFRVAGEDTVQTPAGAIRAVKVERVRDDDDRQTTTWHSPEHDYVAVRLVQIEDGDTTETRLKSYTRK